MVGGNDEVSTYVMDQKRKGDDSEGIFQPADQWQNA